MSPAELLAKCNQLQEFQENQARQALDEETGQYFRQTAILIRELRRRVNWEVINNE